MNLFGSLKKSIFSFGLALALVFAVLFYEEDRLKELFQIAKPDHLSVLYLKLLLNIKPDDNDLRAELVRHYINLGELDEARDALQPLLPKNGTADLSVRLLALEIEFRHFLSISHEHPSRKMKLAELQNSIVGISRAKLPLSVLPDIIKLGLELEQPAVAADLYYRWAKVLPPLSERTEKLKESARWYIASEMPRRAAEIYDESHALAETDSEAREFAFLTLKALQAAGDNTLALQYFRNYQHRFPADPELLDQAISICLADNNPRQAYEMGALRLSFEPDEPEQIRKQLDRTLAVGELKQAAVLAERLVETAPEDGDAHETLGRIAEWALMPEIALKEWLWLARNKKDEAAIMHALRLSNGLYSVDTSLEMLNRLSDIRELTGDELNSVMSAYSAAGNFSSHVNFLQSYVRHYPDNPQAWEALAKTQENAGQLTGAMETWQRIGSRFNRLPEAVTHQAKLMWKNGQVREGAFSSAVTQRQHGRKRNPFLGDSGRAFLGNETT